MSGLRMVSRARAAFTLIELLVVVAIIALLIAILLPALGNAKRIAMQTRCGTNLADMGRAIQAYQSEYGKAQICQRSWYTSSGWATNQTVYIRSDLSGNWSIIGFLGPYLGTGASKIVVCPAVPTSPLAAMALSNGNSTWWDYANNKIVSGSGTIWGYGTYMFFVGDQGNGVNGGANPGGTNPFHSSVDYTNTDGTPYNQINIPPTLLSVPQNLTLVQDFFVKDTTPGIFQGNHPRIGGQYLPETSYRNSGNGRYYLTSGYYVSGSDIDYAGANVLQTSYAVEWRKTSELRKVVAGGTSNPWTVYSGFPE